MVGILACDNCGNKLTVGYGGKGKQYKCDSQRRGACGKLARNLKTLDDFMTQLTYEALKRVPKPTVVKVDRTPELIKKYNNKISEARNAYKADVIGLEDFVDIRTEMQAKISERKKTTVQEPMPVDSADAFLKADMDKQRDTIRRLWPVIGVKACGKGHKFSPDHLAFPKAS